MFELSPILCSSYLRSYVRAISDLMFELSQILCSSYLRSYIRAIFTKATLHRLQLLDKMISARNQIVRIMCVGWSFVEHVSWSCMGYCTYMKLRFEVEEDCYEHDCNHRRFRTCRKFRNSAFARLVALSRSAALESQVVRIASPESVRLASQSRRRGASVTASSDLKSWAG
jgi:hypothetical protein